LAAASVTQAKAATPYLNAGLIVPPCGSCIAVVAAA
jgi:hypothetical protein